MWLLIAGCSGPDTSPDASPSDTDVDTDTVTVPHLLTFTDAPRIAEPDAVEFSLTRRLIAATSAPTSATITVRPESGGPGRTLRFTTPATSHDLPLLGLRAGVAYLVEATFTEEGAPDVDALTADLPIDPMTLPAALPTTTLVSAVPERMEPGYTVFPAEVEGASFLVAVDAEGVPVWSYDAGEQTVRALSFRDGAFTTLIGLGVTRLLPVGVIVTRWSPGTAEGTVPLAHPLHHEIAVDADGSFWSLYKDTRHVDAYPTSEDDPFTTAPADIDDDRVLHFAADGTVLSDWSMADRLDPTRIGYGSLDLNGEAYDWAHANAIVPRTDLGLVLVSLRHQDAVVALDPAGDLQWILGNHDGWPPELVPYLLEPTGVPFAWQYHQHAPTIGPEGRILLFDNGNDNRTTPYSRDPKPGSYSRIAEFEVDSVNRTVRQTFEHAGDGGDLFSQALGNADVLPTTGNALATYAFLHQEGGVKNVDVGLGDRTVRVMEVVRETGEVVFDLRIATTLTASPTGLLTDRAIRVPTLYGPDVIEEIAP